ncbi:hypothetical protein L873DRAFT_1802730 [Choiromyces venosus 120613-1]|uniref:RNA 3'-terminal phosphate cyclase domain-containing protein n=1 Tax=Choiromyces venosus 120613-1 TaxID=1336337 RepID=A0A3N4JYH9_9PEZI|nr:hypothetical protein L873DRAFT_1802730 [Choiromyces venosus 120613-1]
MLLPAGELPALKEALIERLNEARLAEEIEIAVEEDSGHNKRRYLLLVAQTSNGYILGRDVLYSLREHRLRMKDSDIKEYMIATVVNDLTSEINFGGCVDRYMQDKLVIYQALSAGRSFVNAGSGRKHAEGSLHTKTARWVMESLAGVKFGGEAKEEVVGVGLKAGTLEWN